MMHRDHSILRTSSLVRFQRRSLGVGCGRWLFWLRNRCGMLPMQAHGIIDTTYAVVGFGEACLPEIDISPPDCAAPRGYPAAQSGGERESWRAASPPNLPLGAWPRNSCSW